MAGDDELRPGDATTFSFGGPGAEPGDRSTGPVLCQGSVLGHFRIERLLGRGGMGEVHAARDLRSGGVVALKTLGQAQPAWRTRFKREFRTLADVEHPNLVRFGELVIGPEVEEQTPAFFTMELVEGDPFVRW
ncbi:MAG: protein kinase, partial [Myxococcales bacterium]|nr:protein kinase [Myxococcales bacterium]